MTERHTRHTPPADGAVAAPAADDGRIRVVLADDHALVRAGLAALVNAEPDMCVVGEAADGEMACRAAASLEPDVLVMDLSMPVLGGAEATARITRDNPAVRVLALTVHEERVYLAQLLRAGAAGYVLKRAAPEDLVRAIRAVTVGGTYIDPAVADVVVGGFLSAESGAAPPRPAAPAHEVNAGRDLLSDRERTVIQRIARGFSNKEIAADLGVSIKTVETYKARVSEKLGLRSRAEIVRYAAQQGWLTGA